ncbi:MFS transporter [Meiothermus rufus]|uniref:MFS transporter n=1 Tax=Meiothermus rufus TaxID=604332 RepID=UPI00040E370A|nr:MFS transporter [Meiothermus rufus]
METSVQALRRRLTLGSALGLFMTGAVGAAVGAVVSAWQAELGLGRGLAWYFNLFFVGVLLGTFWSSRMRRRHPWLSLALLAEGLGLLLVAGAGRAEGIYLAALFLGFGVSTANFHCNALPLELYTRGQMLVLGRVNAAFGLRAVLSPLLMVWLPWRWGYAILAFLAVLAALLLWQAPAVQPKVSASSTPSRPQLLPWVLASILAYVAVELVISSFSGLYLRHLDYDAKVVGVLLSLYWVGLTLGRWLLAGLMAVHPLARLAGLHLGAALVALCYLLPPVAWLFPLVGFLLAPTFPTLYAFTQRHIGYPALAYLFYAAAVGGSLVPAAFALVPKESLALGMLCVVGGMAGTTYLLWRNSEAQSAALRP